MKSLTFFFAILISVLTACCPPTEVQSGAEHEAQIWLAAQYPDAKVRVATCVAQDSNADGYVSCTGRADATQMALDCGFPCSSTGGCRLSMERD